ncbi:glycosyltransferase [Patescibacteria group bacterium]|nr:glycosyltransferase [Patescibacteria group bacterium]
MNIVGLSVFFPCINEEGSIEDVVCKTEQILKKLKFKHEIIIVNDGSTDRTGQIADRMARENPNIKVIHHAKNLGYGEALKSGFYNARYETIVYTDGDGQFDFSEVHKFLDKIKDYDLVIGYRIKRQDSFFRRIFGRGWRLTLLVFFRLTLKDVDCGFKMVSKKVLEGIPHLESQRGAMINAELAIKAKKYGFRVGQVGVNHYPRLSGKPTGVNIRVIIKSYLDFFKLWWKLKKHKNVFIIFLLILALAVFLRFYRLPEYMTFLGDEGRDAIIVKNIIKGINFPLIGPPTSVGNIYLGPLYYYLMAIPMFIFNLNPAAAAGMNAMIGVATVALIYYIGKHWFSPKSGLIAAYLYAISPVTIIYSRSSWNPNPAPFFSLLAILGLFKAHSSRNYKWLILTGVCAAAAVQMHYLALILLLVLAAGWLKELFAKISNSKSDSKGGSFWAGTVLAAVVFLLIMSPLFVFDLKHNFLNYKAISAIFLDNQAAVNFNLFDTLNKVIPIYNDNLVARYLTGENPILTPFISTLILAPFLWITYLMRKKRQYNYGFWILGIWLLIGTAGLALYKQNIYDHYLGFLNPVPFLLLGSLASISISSKRGIKKLLYVSWAIIIILLTIVNLQKNPLINQPNNQLKKTQEISKFIISQVSADEFNFALIAERNYDSAYQFYLDLYGYKPKEVPFDITEQLFVVCEDPVCDPTHSAKYEVAAFGWSKVDWQKDLYGVKIYRLIPNPSGKP